MLKKIWIFIWEGGYKGGLKHFLLLAPPMAGILWVGNKICMRFDVPSPYAEILLFIFILIPILGLTLLGNYFDQRKRSKLSHGPRSHYEYGQFAKHFADQGVPEELYYTVYRCLQESFEDSRFKVMPSDALSLYQDGNGSMDAKSLFEFIQSERLLKKYGLEMPGKAELGRAKTVEEVVQLANRYLRSK